MNHERFDELKEAYVLGALPEEERRELEEYLARHPERQAEVDELGAFAGLLALTPQEHEPPSALRRSIMSVVESEARSSSARSEPRFAGLREVFSLQNLGLAAAAVLVIGLFSWNIEGNVPEPGGLFEPRGESVAAVVEKPLDEGDVIAVTIEPAGGSQQPTTDPLMTAKL